MTEMSLFDFLPEEEAARFKPLKSDDWKWTFADYPKEKNGLKVFSCFACGGGSTMGYKLAGCEVVGCCEIDPRMNKVYVQNHKPAHNFLMDIREFNAIPNDELPEELFNLDILDGSPPCTTFSMAGQREETWGKEKKFAEGQKMQTLDDLAFVFIETVKKLKPKTVIMENVEGLMLGEAFSYIQKIYKDLHDAGYKTHHWLLKGERMGIPQNRHRVFFVAIKDELNIDPYDIDMTFNYEPIKLKEVRDGKKAYPLNKETEQYKYLNIAIPSDKTIRDSKARNGAKKATGFTDTIAWDDDVCPTFRACKAIFDGNLKGKLNKGTYIHCQTFPEDYDFCNEKYFYVIGMSVPPVMIKRIIQRLIEEGVFAYKGVRI